MELIKAIFTTFMLSWFFIFIYLYLFLYLNYAREHKVKLTEKITSIPSYLSPASLSKLLYNKIIPEVYIATIFSLINKNVLYIKDDYLYVNRSNDLKLSSSQKYALKLLINHIGDGEKVSIDYLDGYCDNYNTASNFYVNYQVWLKMAIVESNDDKFYEDKMGYYKIKMFKYAGIVLWVMNFYIGFRVLFGFFLIIPAWYILFFYYRVYRRTPESQEDYTKWMAYRDYLLETKHIKSEDVVYSPILHVEDKCEFDNKENLDRLSCILKDCIKRANNYGTKGPIL